MSKGRRLETSHAILPSSSTDPECKIGAVLAALQDGWNRHDMAVFAAQFSQERTAAAAPHSDSGQFPPPRIILAPMNRRTFLQATVAGVTTLALSHHSSAADNPDLAFIQKEIEKRHDESVQRLQQWIRQPSIAAEKRGMEEGCDLTMRMLRDAGFGQVTKIPTDGQPGIFATLDAGAPRTVGLYFMYDVKQADPAECRRRHLTLRSLTNLTSEKPWSDEARSTRKAPKPPSWLRCMQFAAPRKNLP
jgi:hypothetical protein